MKQTNADNAVRSKAGDKAERDYLAAYPGDKGGAKQARTLAETQVKRLQGDAKLAGRKTEASERAKAAADIAKLTGAKGGAAPKH